MTEDIYVLVGGSKLSNFQSVSLTRGIKRVPSEFSLTLPNDPTNNVEIQPGYACTISFGNDLALTGVIDQYAPELDSGNHAVSFSGVNNFSNLVRNSAVLSKPSGPGDFSFMLGASLSGTVNSIATQLCQPFGIAVTGINSSQPIPILQFSLGQTPYEIIENISRYARLLVFDNPDGNLVFANVAQSSMASGFTEGVNCTVQSSTFNMAQRYSDYYAVANSVDAIKDVKYATGNVIGYASDAGVKSLGLFRPYIFVSEQSSTNPLLGNQRAQWECDHRFGEGNKINIRTNSWRDSAGTLWTPNAKISLDLPSVKVDSSANINWVIGEVTYSYQLGAGHVADLTIYPAEAFTVEPVSLDAEDWDFFKALNKTNNPSAPKS